MRCVKVLALLLACTVVACSSDDTTGSEPGDDGPVVADEGAEPDAGAPDVGESEDTAEPDPDVGEPEWSPPPVAPHEELQPIPIDSWRIATMEPGADGAILEALDFDTFEYPEGGNYLGGFWHDVSTGDDSTITISGFGILFYAVAQVTVDQDMAVVAHPDGISSVWVVGTWRASGDPYRSGRHRVPLYLTAGENLIVLRGARRGSQPRFEIASTSHVLAFNTADITAPELEAQPPHPEYVGLPVLNLGAQAATDIRAKIVESEHLAATELRMPSIAAGASVQVPFAIEPKGDLPTDGTPITATLRVESPSLEHTYEKDVEIATRNLDEGGAVIRRTFLSGIDRSAQFYGVNEPSDLDEGKAYSLILSLHGASVNARGQAAAYGSKDWHYVVAATNRRPFGFDWESFGRLDGLEVLQTAMDAYSIDPTRVYVSGHSMGGHGTWQFGHLFPGRFALVGPSAGWIDFNTYNGTIPAKNGPFGWAALSSYTRDYSTNLTKRAVFVIHGTADDNVPVAQAETMMAHLEPIVDDLHVHYEEGAGHWWDGDLAAGADCVDWPDMFDLMQSRTLDPWELSFTFVSPSPGVSPQHSFVTVGSTERPDEPFELDSAASEDGKSVSLDTENVRGLVLDGDALGTKGVETVVVNGAEIEVAGGGLPWGEQTGKSPAQYGPLVQVFQQPFCLVWADAGPVEYREYAADLLTTWNIIGNGTGCGLPLSEVTDEVRAAHNIVYLGVPTGDVPLPDGVPMSWDESNVSVDGQDFGASLLGFVFPEGDRLAAVITTTRTHEYLLFVISPFNSRFWIPDWIVYTDGAGTQATGFFDGAWKLAPAFSFLP